MTLIPRLARAALFSALASTALLSWAQGPTAASPAKKDLVQKVLQLQQGGFEGMATALAERSIAPLGQQAGAFLQARVPAEQREALAKDIQAEFVKYGNDVVPMLRERVLKLAPTVIAPLMEEKFSEDELTQVVAALESPGFRKYMQLTPELQRVLSEKLVAEMQPQVEPKLKALDQLVSKKLTAAAGPAAAPANSAPAAAAKASGAKK